MITVEPTTFTKVEFDADAIARLAQEALERIQGVPNDLDVAVRIDEDAATTRFAVASLEPLVLDLDGGSIESLRDPRRLGVAESELTFTRIFLEVLDRRSPSFGAPPLDAEVSQAHKIAWDVNLHGRVAELGLRLHKPRFRYNFRNRHGFTDHGDRIFDELWSAGVTTWARIVELSDTALAVPTN